MADSFIQAATDGAGKKLDTRTEATNSEHRQVVVIGDPATNAGVAPVDATKGLAVDLTASGALTAVTTVAAVTNLSQLGGQAVTMGTGVRTAGTQRVTIATDDVVPASQSGTWTVQPGNTANTTPWLAKISDGTNAITIKAASTAPAATDPAGVVAISPNSWDTGSGTGGSKTQRVIIDSSQFSAVGQTTKSASAPVTIASDQGFAGNVGGITVTQAASSTITRPADTTAYASGDLVANSTTAGSVNNLQFTTLARISGGSGVIVGAQIQKSTTSTTNAAFRLHLFNTAPTYTTAGDNSAISSVVVASGKGYLGYIDITAMIGFSDVAWGSGAPDNSRGGIPYVATAQIIYGLLEARGAYTPGNAEVFTVTVDALQD